MKFEIDKQTIKDLEIFGSENSDSSIFNFYNKTKTNGGRDFLTEMMKNPLTDIIEINKRTNTIKSFSSFNTELKINSAQLSFIETYIRLNIPSLKNNLISAIFKNLEYKLKPNNDYYLIQSGIEQLIHLINYLKEFLSPLKESNNEIINRINDFVNKPYFSEFELKSKKINFKDISKLDFIFRNKFKNELVNFIESIYALDAYTSIAKLANDKQLNFADYNNSLKPNTSIKNLYHPLIKNAVPYDIKINQSNNLCFLTGPNMAGKSTFLKSVGISIYLSHLGFPIPAKKMNTSIYNGIITTINISDNMNKGYSHFYSEVRRVKEVAIKIRDKNNLLVIFDELFRGTNVKDACDASSLIINSFAKISKSIFYISTHITEIAEKLNNLNNIDFKYFDSKIIYKTPAYNYELKDGISSERLGMYIVENENIISILDSIKEK